MGAMSERQHTLRSLHLLCCQPNGSQTGWWRIAAALLSRGAILALAAAMAWCGLSVATSGEAVPPPAPLGPLPTGNQLRWHQLEFYGLLHFGLNTFTDREWGFGDESPALFNPSAFDPDQIATVAAEAGMKGLILVCKHHDGFCLWPTKTTEHSVRHSPWRGGRGDIVREIAGACRRHGLLFGVYLSSWDRNCAAYGKPAYLAFYRAQLRELLTGYGEVFISWHDGAHGDQGYYGGARDRRVVDPRTYYRWPETWALIRRLQPRAVIFSDAGPDVRWCGNEDGSAGEPCWATLDLADFYPGTPEMKALTTGDRRGADWAPPECDVSIRPGWFYHAREDLRVKSVGRLVDIYFASVGRGGCLDLNVPPDTSGRIHANDAAALRGMGAWLAALFATNYTHGAHITASNTRGGTNAASTFGPEKLLDGDRTTYWATDDAVTTAQVVLDLRRPQWLSVVQLREYLPLGQRIEGFALDRWEDQGWHEFFHGTSIGNQRLVRVPRFETNRLRLRITQAAACPALAELGLFLEPRSASGDRSP